MNEDANTAKARIGEWWQSGITDFESGKIWLRGYPVEQLIGRTSFAATAWLLRHCCRHCWPMHRPGPDGCRLRTRQPSRLHRHHRRSPGRHCRPRSDGGR